jgi:uncharacterized membrane protein YhaH (DUF805 family)
MRKFGFARLARSRKPIEGNRMRARGGYDDTAAIWEMLFSLKGTVSRDQWLPAFSLVASMFGLGVSLLGERAEELEGEVGGPSWLLVLWCAATLYCGTLLCAKRLLDCKRPAWLALTVALPGLLLIAGHVIGFWHSWPVLSMFLLGYLALFSLPALIACATCDA